MTHSHLSNAAVAIHEQLSQPRIPLVSLNEAGWIEHQRLVRQLDVARDQGWFQAAKRIQQRLLQSTTGLREHFANLTQTLAAAGPRVPSPGELYADLIALKSEFPEVRVERKRRLLIVRTDAIAIEDVELGAFEIRLYWEKLSHVLSYDIDACDPSPASEHAGTIHPHVQNNTLCEGEGRNAIRAALAEGRLFDFFTIVNSILHTYNPDSAYTRMEDWDGISCTDCGRTMHTDDECSCEACSTTSCLDCTTGCTDCGDRYCCDCISECEVCDEPACTACLRKCNDCDETCCRSCLNNDNLCEECIEQETETTNEATTEEEESRTPDNPVHAVLMEQAALFA